MCAKRNRQTAQGPSRSYYQGDASVLYIHPAKQGMDFHAGEETGRSYGLIPVGLPALVNNLRAHGIQVRGVNQPLEMQLSPAFSLKNWLRLQRKARIVLIDLHWYEHCYGAISVVRLCKQTLPEAWVVLGGLTASGFASQILENFPEVDIIVRGDAERPLLALVQLMLKIPQRSEALAGLTEIPNLSYRLQDKIVENELSYCAATTDLDALNFVDLEFLEHYRQYYVHEYIVTDLEASRRALQTNPFWGRWLCTARGCKFECSYCGGCKSAHKTLAGREGLTPRSPELVVLDLKKLHRKGVHQASLSYDIAELGEEYWRALFAGLRSSGIKMGLYNEFFQLPPAEFIEDFVQSVHKPHSCVALSPLSGSERVRRLNGKRYSNNQLFDVLDLLSQHKTYIFVYFSLNLPGETDETIDETIELAKDIYEFYPHSLLKILNSAHTVDPLSPMSLHAEKFGVEISMSTFMDYYHYCHSTQMSKPAARSELHRGFALAEPGARLVERMADRWDFARQGREECWWPIPPGW